MNIVKLLGEDIQLSTTPSIVPGIDGVGAEYVLLQHDHTAGQAHKVIVKDDGGNITGCFHLAPHNPIIIKILLQCHQLWTVFGFHIIIHFNKSSFHY